MVGVERRRRGEGLRASAPHRGPRHPDYDAAGDSIPLRRPLWVGSRRLDMDLGRDAGVVLRRGRGGRSPGYRPRGAGRPYRPG